MLQWIRSINIHPFHLTLPVLALYYWMYTGHLLAPIFLLAFFILFSRRYNGKQFLILVGLLLFAALCFAFRVEHGKQEARDQEVPRVIQLLPDTIKVNGDTLSFRAQSGSRTFQVFYQLQTKEEQAYFKHLDHGLELRIKGELETPTKQRNFMGFDYQAYLKTQGIYHLLKISQILEKRPAEPRDLIGLLSSWRRKALVWVHQHFPPAHESLYDGLAFWFFRCRVRRNESAVFELGDYPSVRLVGHAGRFLLRCFSTILSPLGIGAGKSCNPPLSVFASLCWDDGLFGFGRSKPYTEASSPARSQRNGEYGDDPPFVAPFSAFFIIDCWRTLILCLCFYIDANLVRGGEVGNPKSRQGESGVNTRGSSFFDFFLWRIPALVSSSNLCFFSLI